MSTAFRTAHLAHIIVDWAAEPGAIADANPMDRTQSGHRYCPPERVPTNPWNAAGDKTYGSLVKLLILTGQRVGTISKLSRVVRTEIERARSAISIGSDQA